MTDIHLERRDISDKYVRLLRVVDTEHGPTKVWMCKADGCLVTDREQHEMWHVLTDQLIAKALHG